MIAALPPLNAPEREARGHLAFTGLPQAAVCNAVRVISNLSFGSVDIPLPVLEEAKLHARDQIARRMADDDTPLEARGCVRAGVDAALYIPRTYLAMRN